MFYQFAEVVFKGRTIRYITPEPDNSIDSLVGVLEQSKKENENLIVVIVIPDAYSENFITSNKTREDVEFWELYTKTRSPHADFLGKWTRAYYQE